MTCLHKFPGNFEIKMLLYNNQIQEFLKIVFNSFSRNLNEFFIPFTGYRVADLYGIVKRTKH